MCTVTAFRAPRGWIVTMNRDERRSRGPEIPPFEWEGRGFVAPRDSDAGGTWIGLRRDGVWAALLNGYGSGFDGCVKEPLQTRGRLVPAVLRESDPVGALRRLNLSHTQSFRVLIGTSAGLENWFWDGRSLEKADLHQDQWTLITSSSYEQEAVRQARLAMFRRWLDEGAETDPFGRPLYHLSSYGMDPVEAVLMSRDVSHTKSCIQLDTAADNPVVRHWDAAPFTKKPSTEVKGSPVTARVGRRGLSPSPEPRSCRYP
ncbi:NRDE family protein [Parvularcula maris]|uniref:NRDE family protein n=1 Tax=Parvularcula maris TaxID=2965077 RepID=A0A9X2L914_9PROT|nr:NRDE family protein [Parvularcula maris]MCQ8184462.1 NRDE family protein [Parvularcula maris]